MAPLHHTHSRKERGREEERKCVCVWMGCWLTCTHCTQGVCDNHCYGNGSQYQDVDLVCGVLLPAGYRSHFLIPLTSTHPCCIVTVECKCRLCLIAIT